MQASTAAVCLNSESKETVAKLEDEFSLKLRLNQNDDEEEEVLESFNNKNIPSQQEQHEHKHEQEQDDQEEEEEEFTFACVNPDGSPISADDIFQDGQIRPYFPLFDRNLLFSDDIETKTSSSGQSLRPPLKKLFIEEPEGQEGPFCTWTGKEVGTSPEVCKKSNSTGFSKLRRFRELVLRSNSDGKDAFVFLHHKGEKGEKVVTVKKEEKKRSETASSKAKAAASSSSSSAKAHERLYVRNRERKAEDKRKSYLPYRVGFFTNVNGLSRNVHPY